MRRTERLQEVRKMRFEEAYGGWQERRLTQARRAIFEFIKGWYHPHRRHRGLGQQSPMAFERSDQEAA